MAIVHSYIWRNLNLHLTQYTFMYTYSKNENYLARFIDFFERQVGLKLKAEETLTELVRDNE